eukprot:7055598-Alexandrium_andersonii.AAC.1
MWRTSRSLRDPRPHSGSCRGTTPRHRSFAGPWCPCACGTGSASSSATAAAAYPSVLRWQWGAAGPGPWSQC